MATLKQKISLVIVILSAIICISVPFIMGISSVKIFHRKNSSIFRSVNDTEGVKYDITFSSDKQVFPLFPTLLNSIYSNLGLEEYANVHIIVMPDVTPDEYSKLLKLNDNLGFSHKLTLMFYPFTYKLNYKQTLKHVSEATMCRLLLPEILDPRIDKILYVDTDAIINHSLRQLFKTEIKSECGIVARSSTNSNIINEWLKKDDLINYLQYNANRSFNAGVLLLSLNKLRRNHFVNNTLSLVQKWGINDQIALNFYCNGTYDELPMDYNFWAGRDDWKDSVRHKIVHFAGPDKPWKINYQPYEEQLLWYKYFLSYPQGEKMIPPLKPTYIFLLKYNNNLNNETLVIPEIILNSKKCRYMIHILAINYKGKHKENLEKQIKSYIKDDFWITYNFLNEQSDKYKDPDELVTQYALFKTPQILREYVERTFLVFDNIPNSQYLCKAERPLEPESTTTTQSHKYNDNIFGMDHGLDLSSFNGFDNNYSFNQQIETSGMTTTSTSTTYSSVDTTNSETNHINNRVVDLFNQISGINSDKLFWCIEILNHQLYYLNLQLLRLEKKRIEKIIKSNNIDPWEIFNSECYKIPTYNNDNIKSIQLEQIETIGTEPEKEDNFNSEINNNDIISNNVHIQNKLYF
ncbi:uncharacterized protein cubi_02094 [Cryptosporidium ubiquitum]|uniref:Uncharacterized protein n=1 Tax=Cryptosporidium ubiquitum TaxID=857276 RepID=A0A1J4MRR4_9CRYT|nr:uncharacterized protein cubi_02094 [Cryptosporidium ubiquitum]OII75573.1 hypothetical protein cubi_02094 [Cryptosporidium ubiquitum]